MLVRVCARFELPRLGIGFVTVSAPVSDTDI
jgi:hypothetical protein